MRLMISTAAILLLSACQVSKDDANDSVSVTYNRMSPKMPRRMSATLPKMSAKIANGVEQPPTRSRTPMSTSTSTPTPTATRSSN